ncbi:MAG: hypothetical protein KJZ80_07335 [Hyphomicrobiaceae bacterium]|nr:hypothetical protein [Hyphomicrobiaceae bacterium]
MVRLRFCASKCIPAEPAAWRIAAAALWVLLATFGAAGPANAHGFGQRYELPLPLSLYLFGAAAAVLLSFAVFGLFVRRAPARGATARVDLLAGPLGKTIGHPAVILTLRLVVLVLFVVVVLAGLLGEQNPYRNIAPTLAWIIWWVGLAYVAAFAGDIWALASPWTAAFDGAQWLYLRFGGRGALGGRLSYPQALSVWPASMLLLVFAWIELVYPNAAAPAAIAWLAIGYSALTWAGMLAFGRDTWLKHGEVFSVVFGTFARFAPTEAKDGRLLLRPYGAGLLEERSVSTSMMAFVLLLLATVLYDGLIGTGEWAALEDALSALSPIAGEPGVLAIRSAGLVVVWLLFLGAYLGISAVMSALAGGRPGPLDVARSFALTLIPIAIGYHVAHYLVFLLVQGQYVIPLLSDPFGYGWDLLGTAGYHVDIGLVGARFAWYAAVAAIVAGHAAAVYFAHVKAIEVFDAPGASLRTQVPLTALMVVYTFIGLSITAEPIVESRAATEPSAVPSATIAIPADAVLPRPHDGRLAAPGPDKTARVKLTYKVLGSAFHDATRMSAADLLYAYAFAYRWSGSGGGTDPSRDAFIEAATSDLRRHLVAVRIVGSDTASSSFRVGDVDFVREVFTVEVYLAMAPNDPDWIGTVAPPWTTVPWHVLVLMEEAVARGLAAFSQAESKRRGLEWLDLARSEGLNVKLASLVEEFGRDGYRPEALQTHVSQEQARLRWRALGAFYKANGHFLVTNGPYKLKSWTPQGVTLEAFRDLTYPLGVGSYDAYAIPRRGFVTKVERAGERLTLSGDIEVVEKFQRSYRLERMPLQSVSAPVLKRAAPECRYVVTNMDGRVALVGVAPLESDAQFRIDLTDRLRPGQYVISALVAVNGNVMNAEVHRIPFAASSQR